MRRLFTGLAVVIVVALGASTALATTTTRTSLRAIVAEAGWDIYNEETGAGEAGALQFARFDGETEAQLWISRGEIVVCEGAGTPSPSDDVLGFVGTEINAFGPATLSVGRSYSSATGSATLRGERFTYNECTGSEGSSTNVTITVSVSLAGVSPIGYERTHSTVRIPNELRGMQMVRAEFRSAAGQARVNSRTIEVDGLIGELTLKSTVTTE